MTADERNPHAASILRDLVRVQAHLPPAEALIAESFAYATLQGGPEFARWLAERGTRVRRDERDPPVLVSRDGDVVTATLNRPRLHNLYSAAMRDGLVEILQLIELDGEATLALRGAGRSFCAGGDLAEFGTVSDPATAHRIRMAANAAPHLLAVRDRVHAYVHGACVGAGIELAAFAARVTAAPDAVFALPEVSMGLIPGAGGTVSIARRIGADRLVEFALSGERIDAPTALDWGLVDEIAELSTTAR